MIIKGFLAFCQTENYQKLTPIQIKTKGLSKGKYEKRPRTKNPKDIIKCVFEQTIQKAEPCLPCVCPVICKLDPKLCKYCEWEE